MIRRDGERISQLSTLNPLLGQVLRFALEIILLATCAYLAKHSPEFLTADNLLHVLRAVAPQGLIAFGMTLVILVEEIDLSVGAAASFAGCLVAYLTQAKVPIPLGILITVSAGALFGTLIGWMRNQFQVPTFITSLGLMTGLTGAALMITGGFPITPFPPGYSYLASGVILGIPFPVLMMALGFVATHVTLKYTGFGRAIYAVGGNPEASRLAGISVRKIRLLTLAITGALAAWSGVIVSARIMSGTPGAAEGWELDVIAAVVIGGTRLSGGEGSVWGTLVGVVFMGVILNGMTLLNVPSYEQYVVRGVLIFAAVLVSRFQSTLRRVD